MVSMVGRRKPRVYLAGGMHSGWQDFVLREVGAIAVFLDPRSHGLKEPHAYVRRDLALVRKADIVFACLERSNPSGFGLAVEIGFAHALGKKVILVDEIRDRYTRFCDEVADFNEATLQAGVERLMAIIAARKLLSEQQ